MNETNGVNKMKKLNKYERAIVNAILEIENTTNLVGEAIWHNDTSKFRKVLELACTWAEVDTEIGVESIEWDKVKRQVRTNATWLHIDKYYGDMFRPNHCGCNHNDGCCLPQCCSTVLYFNNDTDLPNKEQCLDYNHKTRLRAS
jgi:hypothetical protein